MQEGAACIPNIGRSQRRQRLTGGVLALILAVALLVVLVSTGVPRPARLLVAIPLLGGVLGVLQAKEKT